MYYLDDSVFLLQTITGRLLQASDYLWEYLSAYAKQSLPEDNSHRYAK
jgi:hypothetical protein